MYFSTCTTTILTFAFRSIKKEVINRLILGLKIHLPPPSTTQDVLNTISVLKVILTCFSWCDIQRIFHTHCQGLRTRSPDWSSELRFNGDVLPSHVTYKNNTEHALHPVCHKSIAVNSCIKCSIWQHTIFMPLRSSKFIWHI